MNNQPGFFDTDNILSELSTHKDPLEKLNEYINWELFRKDLNKALKKQKSASKGAGGRPAFDIIMMFKIMILQKIFNLSDDQTEYQILDRFSFRRFLGLDLSDKVPDAKTIWLFRDNLQKSNVVEKLFNTFIHSLDKIGIRMSTGSIIDASFVSVPKQRNTRDENKLIKSGKLPEDWKDKPNKLRQKDLEARWTKKNNQVYYGYKNHIKADRKTKLIKEYIVSSAEEHDSQLLEYLIGNEDKVVYADSAYSGEPIDKILTSRNIKGLINLKGTRNHPLTETQKQYNRKLSKTRARVEHIFGIIKNSFNGNRIRCIGFSRAFTQIGLINLTYNLTRTVFLLKTIN